MLRSLLIKNYALIRQLEIMPSPGMNIITGETGAGKSIMIGAVGLLLGNRADTKVLYDPGKKCIIEGSFQISAYNLKELFLENDLDYSEETIIRREISPAGKSRAFINDTPVTLDILKELGTHLMDIHSQNDTYKLASLNYQLSLVDVFSRNQDLLKHYQDAFARYRIAGRQLAELEEEAERIRKDADYNHFLYEELQTAGLEANEQESLEEELATLEHAEEIKNGIHKSIELLQNMDFSILENLSAINKELESLASYSTQLDSYKKRVESAYLDLKDLSTELTSESDRIEYDPVRLEEVQNRLNLIYKLLQKHGAGSVTELLELQHQLEEKVNKNLNLDNEINKVRSQAEAIRGEVMARGKELSKARKNNFGKITGKIQEMLKSLGIPEARLDIEHQETEPGKYGLDDITLKFSANKGVETKNLKMVASGGEFSRLMFCVKYLIASKTAMPTLILDEIDAGVSGEIALKMASLMKNMALEHQVVAITHLPQIASSGDAHYFVYKDNQASKSVSLIKKLDEEERIVEIAKMIGGDSPSEAAYLNARELLTKTYIN